MADDEPSESTLSSASSAASTVPLDSPLSAPQSDAGAPDPQPLDAEEPLSPVSDTSALSEVSLDNDSPPRKHLRQSGRPPSSSSQLSEHESERPSSPPLRARANADRQQQNRNRGRDNGGPGRATEGDDGDDGENDEDADDQDAIDYDNGNGDGEGEDVDDDDDGDSSFRDSRTRSRRSAPASAPRARRPLPRSSRKGPPAKRRRHGGAYAQLGPPSLRIDTLAPPDADDVSDTPLSAVNGTGTAATPSELEDANGNMPESEVEADPANNNTPSHANTGRNDDAAEPPPETGDESEGDHEEVPELSKRRSEALEALTQIEIRFANLRDQLFIERMQDIYSERSAVENGVHPQVVAYSSLIDARRTLRLDSASKWLSQQEQEFDRKHSAGERAIWSSWSHGRGAAKLDLCESISSRRRKLDRERKSIDRLKDPSHYLYGPHGLLIREMYPPADSQVNGLPLSEIQKDCADMGIVVPKAPWPEETPQWHPPQFDVPPNPYPYYPTPGLPSYYV